MAVPLTKQEIVWLALPAGAGILGGLWLVGLGWGWALPLLWLDVMLAAAIGYTASAKGPSPTDVEQIRQRLWLRYNPESTAPAGAETGPAPLRGNGGEDRALVYVERVMDRQINKLRGVLSFDALIIAFLSVERTRLPPAQDGADYAAACLFLMTGVLGLLVASSVMCLDLLRVRWSPPSNFDDFAREHATTVKLVAERTKTVERAVRLAEVGVLGAALTFCFVELGLRYFP